MQPLANGLRVPARTYIFRFPCLSFLDILNTLNWFQRWWWINLSVRDGEGINLEVYQSMAVNLQAETQKGPACSEVPSKGISGEGSLGMGGCA